MKIKYFIMLGVFVLLIGSVTPSSVDFYYSPTCPHCESVIPLINSLSEEQYDSNWIWNFFDITKGSYDILGVPTIKIITLDKRKIDLVGSNEIPTYLECELKEMTILDCPTYSVSEGYNLETNSWFIR